MPKKIITLCCILFLLVVFLSCVIFLGQSAAEQKPELRLYLDADLTGAASSSLAIEQGIRTALSEIDNMVAGHRIVLIKKNHHGNSRRSLDNIRDYLSDPRALAVFCRTSFSSPAGQSGIHQHSGRADFGSMGCCRTNNTISITTELDFPTFR